MELLIQFGYPLPRLSRPGGPGLLTTSRSNDCELYRPARRAGLDPLTTAPRGRCLYCIAALLYWRRRVKSLRETKTHQHYHEYTRIRYDLVIGLDRSDRKGRSLFTTSTPAPSPALVAQSLTLAAPEALWQWLLAVASTTRAPRQALCLEQPAVHLIPFLESL